MFADLSLTEVLNFLSAALQSLIVLVQLPASNFRFQNFKIYEKTTDFAHCKTTFIEL